MTVFVRKLISGSYKKLKLVRKHSRVRSDFAVACPFNIEAFVDVRKDLPVASPSEAPWQESAGIFRFAQEWAACESDVRFTDH